MNETKEQKPISCLKRPISAGSSTMDYVKKRH